MNRVANLTAAELSVGVVTRRRTRTGVSCYLADGLIVMVLLAAIGICYSYSYQMRAELDAARAEQARVEAAVAAMDVENARIAAEVEALRTNPDVIERAARQELGMVRPGEMVLAVDRGAGSRR